jgi:hypothetical protein
VVPEFGKSEVKEPHLVKAFLLCHPWQKGREAREREEPFHNWH